LEAVERAGARKSLFGSDGPWLHPGVELAKVRLLGLSPGDEQLVLSGNLLRLIARVHSQSKSIPKTVSRSPHIEREMDDPWKVAARLSRAPKLRHRLPFKVVATPH